MDAFCRQGDYLLKSLGICLFASLVSMLLAGCVSQDPLQPFTTDGCSMFPDRSLINSSDWCECCVNHDLAYWRGGSAEARLKADQALAACVQRASNSRPLADLMLAGVRSGGGPYFFTPYRWGYGWTFGKAYVNLTPAENAAADALEREYRVAHPALTCPANHP